MHTSIQNSIRFYDLSEMNPSLKGFSGSCLCGDFVYYSPLMNAPGNFHGNVIRTRANDVSDIEYSDVTAWFPEARGFVGTLTDDRYVYFVPYHNSRHHGTLLRYDSSLPFEEKDSWITIDLQKLVHPDARGFISGSIYGEYMYLAPYQASFQLHHGLALRYRLNAPIDAVESWEYFDMASVHPDARGFHASISTSDRTWFVPYVSENRVYHGHLMEFSSNNGATFNTAENWTHIDLTRVHPLAKGYVGGCEDGSHLFLAPYFNGIERHGLVLKYALNAPISDVTSWEYFDLTTLGNDIRGFFGAIWHKDFIYFLPHCKEEGIYHGTLVRYDRAGRFDDRESWSILDTTLYHPSSKGFMGCTMVGDTMILCPYETGTMNHSGLLCIIDLTNAPFNTPKKPASR